MTDFHYLPFKSALGEKLMKRNPSTVLPVFLLFMFLWVAPGIARAATVKVNCSPSKGKPQTITAALAALPSKEPNTLLILGTCNENVNITTFDHLTLTGDPTATLNALDPNFQTINIQDSQEVTLNNLLINGPSNNDAVDCVWSSVCHLNNVTIQNAGGGGLSGGGGSALFVTDCHLQNNGDMGIWIGVSSHMIMTGSTIQGNATDGISVFMGGLVKLDSDAANVGNTIQNNLGNGISSFRGSLFIAGTANSTISGNGGDGVALQGASAADIVGVTITNNLGHGVRIGDLSFAQFKRGGSLINSNNTSPNIVCDSAYSAERGVNPTATDTNCPAEIQPLP
jgi:parallel beta helix pectate lyase-like protein